MTDDTYHKLDNLFERINFLAKRQEEFSREINLLREEVYAIKRNSQIQSNAYTATPPKQETVAQTESVDIDKLLFKPNTAQQEKQAPVYKVSQQKSDIERFIGENIISKIGIAITVIGVSIGAKYAIEHQLISPLTRIVLGYLFGIGLMGFAFKLKKNYENYSAVLLSGSMAIMYFITYMAYSFYGLIPQIPAFLLMVVFTVFTVYSAISYNKQIIAHFGLVGSYAIPFLLSEGSGKVAILFSYMAIINIGILVISFKKYWKPLYYSSFFLTWLIYFSWYVTYYSPSEFFGVAFTFLIVFFIIFYLAFLAYKLLQKEKYEIYDVFLLLANTFVFYALGYSIFYSYENGNKFLGLFTVCNALLHFAVSALVYKQKQADKNLLFLILGLVLIFITIAIPVQLNGGWVTVLWAGEAALLFWIGLTKKVSFYELLSYPLMALAFISLIHDWLSLYFTFTYSFPETRIVPVFNVNFLISAMFILAFGFINYLNIKKQGQFESESNENQFSFISFSLPAVFIIALYYTFRLEIANYFHQLYVDSSHQITSEPDSYYKNDIMNFKTIWLINYTLFFLSALLYVNFQKIKNILLGNIVLVLNTLVLLLFLTNGLLTLSELRESYIEQTLSQNQNVRIFNIIIRYISLAFVALNFIMAYKYINQDNNNAKLKPVVEIVLHISFIWVLSSELIHWMDIAKSEQSYKLGLSILWGSYSLFLIILGIWKKKKYLRIGAISLFGVTLLKLFFYDISHLGTISKTIVFVALGILLLIISFLYNKYKNIISD